MIVKLEPNDVDQAPVILATSDAPDNDSAIREIDGWAREHGFFRSREYHLNTRMSSEGQVVRYGACYRLTADDTRAADAAIAQTKARLDRMPMTTSSDILLREN